MRSRVIHIHPEAPRKPPEGAPCNGCGVCCLAEPCPLGVLLSGRRTGACDALRWSDESQVGQAGGNYRCGALSEPQDVLARRLPRALRALLPGLTRALPRLAKRWISAGSGCDCSLSMVQPEVS